LDNVGCKKGIKHKNNRGGVEGRKGKKRRNDCPGGGKNKFTLRQDGGGGIEHGWQPGKTAQRAGKELRSRTQEKKPFLEAKSGTSSEKS